MKLLFDSRCFLFGAIFGQFVCHHTQLLVHSQHLLEVVGCSHSNLSEHEEHLLLIDVPHRGLYFGYSIEQHRILATSRSEPRPHLVPNSDPAREVIVQFLRRDTNLPSEPSGSSKLLRKGSQPRPVIIRLISDFFS